MEGLTTKHVDVPELLKILTFEGGTPEIFGGDQVSAQERVYRTPAEEFELSRIGLPAHGQYAGEATYGPKALLVLHGSATLTAAGRCTSLGRGSIVLCPVVREFVLETRADDLVVFRPAFPFMPGARLSEAYELSARAFKRESQRLKPLPRSSGPEGRPHKSAQPGRAGLIPLMIPSARGAALMVVRIQSGLRNQSAVLCRPVSDLLLLFCFPLTLKSHHLDSLMSGSAACRASISVREKGFDFSGRRQRGLGAGAGDRNRCGRGRVTGGYGRRLSAGEGNREGRVKAVTGGSGIHSLHGECGNLLRRTIAAGQKDALGAELERNIPHPHRQQFFGSSGRIDLDPAQQDLRFGFVGREPGGALSRASGRGMAGAGSSIKGVFASEACSARRITASSGVSNCTRIILACCTISRWVSIYAAESRRFAPETTMMEFSPLSALEMCATRRDRPPFGPRGYRRRRLSGQIAASR